MFTSRRLFFPLLFRLSHEESSFAVRNFQAANPTARSHLEGIGRAFIDGYNAALEFIDLRQLAPHLMTVRSELQGFAFEGAAMALTLLDIFLPRRKRRATAFLNGVGSAHPYMIHVGMGWAYARLGRRLHLPRCNLDALLCWLLADGYGFHEGYFHRTRAISAQTPPARLSGYARRVFDQGLGRSLWFVNGADIKHISRTAAAFPRFRQADLWSGIGLACTYAGGADANAVERLRMASDIYWPQLAQGAAFAAKARLRAGHLPPHSDAACRLLCGVSAATAASITDQALASLPMNDSTPGYEIWRQRIQAHFRAAQAQSTSRFD